MKMKMGPVLMALPYASSQQLPAGEQEVQAPARLGPGCRGIGGIGIGDPAASTAGLVAYASSQQSLQEPGRETLAASLHGRAKGFGTACGKYFLLGKNEFP